MQFFGSCIEVDMHQELFVHDSDNEIKGTDKTCSGKLLCFKSFETITPFNQFWQAMSTTSGHGGTNVPQRELNIWKFFLQAI